MAIVQFTGPGPIYPTPIPMGITPSLSSAMVIAATGDKLAYAGRVAFQGSSGTKNIHKIHLNLGTIVKAGASALTISLQDVDLVNGPVIRPDGVQDQTYQIANINTESGFNSGAWFTTGALSADRTVTYGDLLAIVVEFNGARAGADSITINGIASASSSSAFTSQHQSACLTNISGVWANIAQMINCLLEFDDGTFGWLQGNHTLISLGNVVYNSGTAGADEYCLEFQMPFACEINSISAVVATAGGGNFEMILYSGTTALQTVTVDQNATLSTSARYIRVPIPKTRIEANTTYRIGMRPTTTNNFTLYYFDVNAASHMATHSLGTTGVLGSRVDQGAWAAPTATRRPWITFGLSGVDTGSNDIFSTPIVRIK